MIPEYIRKARWTKVCPECEGPKSRGALICCVCYKNGFGEKGGL